MLTFQFIEEMEEALKNHEALDLWLPNVKKRDKFDCCESRRVWLITLEEKAIRT